MKPEQITAWALDEASGEERERLESELRDDPKARQAADETKEFCHFLLAELRDDSLALTDEQRERLKVQPVRKSSRLPHANGAIAPRPQWRTGVVRLALAACVVLGGFWTWHAYDARQRSETGVAMNEQEQHRVQFKKREKISGDEERGVAASKSPMPAEASEKALDLLAGLAADKKLQAAAEPQPMMETPSLLALSAGNTTMTTKDVAELKKIQDRRAFGLSDDGKPDFDPSMLADASGQAGSGSYAIIGGRTITAPSAEPSAIESAPAPSPVVMNPQPDAFYFANADFVVDADSDGLRREKLVEQKKLRAFRLQLDSRSAGESYTRIIENELKDVAREPLSTFSIDVDTASYANVRRFLNQNTIPPADAVRIEELVNYFPTAEEGPAPTAKEPFAVRVELAPCPWQPAHRLARIAIKGRELGNERKASNLVFLVDVSGSMNEPNRLPLVQQSLRMLTEQLGEEDKVTLVVYAGSSGLVLPPTNGEKKSEILAAIEKLKAGGSTHGSAGIQLAYEQAVAGFIKEGVNRVILCTDGDFNVGVSSPEELEKLITKKAKSGVFLSVLGFGSGNLKDRTMETLADKGNGNYAYIDSLSEARKVLVEQMSGTLVTIAKDVKIQVEFNPAAVRSYRLIGYENRLLAKEDFNDDTKDAGEIGAGHSVVALYEIVPANLPPGTGPRPVVDGLKYQTPATAPAALSEAAKSGEVMTVKLRYKAPDSDLSKLIEMPVKDEGKTLTASSEEYKFSAAVVGFGLLLRDSSYKGTLSWETVRRLALDGKGADKLGYRGEFLQLIDKARGLKETRP